MLKVLSFVSEEEPRLPEKLLLQWKESIKSCLRIILKSYLLINQLRTETVETWRKDAATYAKKTFKVILGITNPPKDVPSKINEFTEILGTKTVAR